MDATLIPDDEELDLTSYRPRDALGRLPGDERLQVSFTTQAVKSPLKSAEAGHPVYDDLPYIQIKSLKDMNVVIETIATDEHKKRFPMEWQRYVEGKAEDQVGIPVTELPGITPARVKELSIHDIRTIETLAEIGEDLTHRVPGLATLRAKAQDYLKRTNDAGFHVKQQAELQKRDDAIAVLSAQLEDLKKALFAKQDADKTAPKK